MHSRLLIFWVKKKLNVSLYYSISALYSINAILAFLVRSKRWVGVFEEWNQGNMERECFEEVLDNKVFCCLLFFTGLQCRREFWSVWPTGTTSRKLVQTQRMLGDFVQVKSGKKLSDPDVIGQNYIYIKRILFYLSTQN